MASILREGMFALAEATAAAQIVWRYWFLVWGYWQGFLDSPLSQLRVFFLGALSPACLVWILYLGVEPFARRRWPKILVAWTRLLSGDWRDQLVARDVFIGSAFGIVVVCLHMFSAFALPLSLGQTAQPIYMNFQNYMGGRFFVADFLDILMVFLVLLSLLFLCLVVLMRSLLRNQTAAIIGCILIFAQSWTLTNPSVFTVTVHLLLSALFVMVLMRFGLVAAAFLFFTAASPEKFPLTFDTSAWYSSYGFAALAILAVIVLYAFRFSLGSRQLLAASHLDD